MKKINIVALLFIAAFCHAQYTPLVWAKKIEAVDQNNPACGITAGAIDNLGNIYAYGQFTDTIIADQNLPTTYLTGNNNWSSGIFAKYDKNGTVIWASKIVPRLSPITINGLSIDKYNNTYILCTSYSADTIDFDPGTGVANMVGTGADFYFAKYNVNGNYVWVKKITVANSTNVYTNVANTIRVDSNQNIYIGGQFQFMMDIDPGSATVNLTNPGGMNCNCTVGFYARYDSTGNYIWGRADVNNTAVLAIDVHEATQQIAIGAKPGSFSGYPLRLCTTSGLTTDSLYGARITVNSVNFDNAGSIYFSGSYSSGGNDFDWSAGSHILSTQATYETQGFAGKYNSNRVLQWATSYNPTGDTTFRAKNYYIHPMIDGNALLSYSESNGSTLLKGFFKISSANGSALWTNSMFNLTVGLVDVNAIQDYSDGSIVCSVGTGISGNALTNIDAEPNPGATSLLSARGSWSMLAKYGNCISPPTITGSVSGTAALCGTAPQTYSIPAVEGTDSYVWLLPNGWSGTSTTNSITATPSANGGTIAVIAENLCGQSWPVSFPVTYTPLPSVSFNASATSVCAGTSVTLTGTGASIYAWSNNVTNTIPFVPTATTTYTVTGVTNGCSATATATITVNPIPVVNINATASTICGGSQVTLTATGANTYAWNNNVTNGIAFIPASTATYTVTGTSNGCSATATATINVNTIPTVSINASATTICEGSPVTLTAAGASTYAWSNNVTNGIAFTPAATTTYTVTGTSSGCSATASATVNVNALPPISINASATTLCEGSPVTLTASGATSYNWSNGVIDGTAFTPASTTTYNVTGTENGCNGTATVTINVNPIPPVSFNASATTVCQGTPVTLTGTGANAYTWSNGVADSIAFAPSITNTYTVTGTSNNCSATATVTVEVNTIPSVSINTTATTICEGTPVTLTGNGATAYTWSNGVANGVAFNPASTTTYTVTGTSNGCSDTSEIAITVNIAAQVTISALADTLCNGKTTLLTASGSNIYQWNTSETADSIYVSPNTTSTYTITATDINGCSATASKEIELHTVVDTSVTVSGATITASQTNAAYQWLNCSTNSIIPNETGQSYTAAGNGDYKVVITAATGCIDTSACATITGLGVTPISDMAIKVWPNPFIDGIQIDFATSLTTATSVQLFNALGELIKREAVYLSPHLLQLNNYSSGIYLLQINCGDKPFRRTVVKQ